MSRAILRKQVQAAAALERTRAASARLAKGGARNLGQVAYASVNPYAAARLIKGSSTVRQGIAAGRAGARAADQAAELGLRAGSAAALTGYRGLRLAGKAAYYGPGAAIRGLNAGSAAVNRGINDAFDVARNRPPPPLRTIAPPIPPPPPGAPIPVAIPVARPVTPSEAAGGARGMVAYVANNEAEAAREEFQYQRAQDTPDAAPGYASVDARRAAQKKRFEEQRAVKAWKERQDREAREMAATIREERKAWQDREERRRTLAVQRKEAYDQRAQNEPKRPWNEGVIELTWEVFNRGNDPGGVAVNKLSKLYLGGWATANAERSRLILRAVGAPTVQDIQADADAGIQSKQEAVKWALYAIANNVDQNQDGTISYDEYYRYMSNVGLGGYPNYKEEDKTPLGPPPEWAWMGQFEPREGGSTQASAVRRSDVSDVLFHAVLRLHFGERGYDAIAQVCTQTSLPPTELLSPADLAVLAPHDDDDTSADDDDRHDGPLLAAASAQQRRARARGPVRTGAIAGAADALTAFGRRLVNLGVAPEPPMTLAPLQPTRSPVSPPTPPITPEREDDSPFGRLLRQGARMEHGRPM